jgi:TonB family protein
LSNWTEQTSQAIGKDFKRLELSPSYPVEACPRKLNGQATFGVVVDADGKIASEPVRIQSAGYRLLNQKAEESLKAYEFPQTGESQAYLVNLPFTHSSEDCAAAPVEESPPS